LVATSAPWNVVKDTVIQVEVYDVPNIKYRVTNNCAGVPIVFDNQTTILSGSMQYEWDFGDGSPLSSQTSPTHLYSGVGGYVVKLKVTSLNGCVSSLSKNAYQFARPVPDFMVVKGNCDNEVYEFSNNSSISMGVFGNQWNFDDNNSIATVSNPKYDFTNAGTRNVKLKVVSEFGCSDSITKAVVVKPAPLANFSFPSSCSLTPTQFSNSSVIPAGTSVLVYNWDFSDGATSTQANPSRLWTSIGPKSVKLQVVTTNGCSHEITKDLKVGVEPNVDFDIADHCAGNTAEVYNKTSWPQGVITYLWDFSGVIPSSTDRIPPVMFPAGTSSTVNVSLTATVDGSCSQTLTKAITISASPETCQFDAIRDYSKGIYSYRFEPTGGSVSGISYKWFTGDGTELNSSGSGVEYTYKWSDKFCVTLVGDVAPDVLLNDVHEL
jgi:PKD repeat protein